MILWLQALKYPCGVCAHLIHTQSSLDTEPLNRKSLPQSRSIRVFSGASTRWAWAGAGPGPGSTATWEEPLHLCISYYIQIWILWSNSFKRCPSSTAWALFWQPPAQSCLQTVLHLVFKAEEQKVASVLRRWKLSIHLFFTVTCSGPHFTNALFCLLSFLERKVLLKLF